MIIWIYSGSIKDTPYYCASCLQLMLSIVALFCLFSSTHACTSTPTRFHFSLFPQMPLEFLSSQNALITSLCQRQATTHLPPLTTDTVLLIFVDRVSVIIAFSLYKVTHLGLDAFLPTSVVPCKARAPSELQAPISSLLRTFYSSAIPIVTCVSCHGLFFLSVQAGSYLPLLKSSLHAASLAVFLSTVYPTDYVCGTVSWPAVF